MWKNRLPQLEDVRTSWGLFGSLNYIQILHGLEWFNTDIIKKEYEFYNKKQEVKEFLDNIKEVDSNRISTKHNDVITILKNS